MVKQQKPISNTTPSHLAHAPGGLVGKRSISQHTACMQHTQQRTATKARLQRCCICRCAAVCCRHRHGSCAGCAAAADQQLGQSRGQAPAAARSRDAAHSALSQPAHHQAAQGAGPAHHQNSTAIRWGGGGAGAAAGLWGAGGWQTAAAAAASSAHHHLANMPHLAQLTQGGRCS
jgi:hypothetical protein